MPYVNPIDPATPAAGAFLSEGDDRIRELKLALIERLETLIQSIDDDPLVFIAGIVGTDDLANSAVTTPKLADDAVTTLKIIDEAVTNSKLASGIDGSKITDGTVDTPELKDGAVTSDKLNAAIQVPDGSITNAKVADDTLETDKLSVAARALVSLTKSISVNVVTGNHGSDTNTQVASAAFVGAKINDPVSIGFHDMDAVTEDRLQDWKAYVDDVDHVKLYIANNSGGLKTWSTCTVKLFITKPISEW